MDFETLRQTVTNPGLGALWIALATGFFFSFNPVAIAAIPVSLAYVTKSRTPMQGRIFGGFFILGMLTTHALLGLIAGMGGAWVEQLLGRAWGLVLGPLLIILGLMWPGWLRLPLPTFSLQARPVTNALSAFTFGVPFSVAICPFCTPALVILLGVATAIGSPIYGMLLLLVFAVGRSIPVAIGATAMGLLGKLAGLGKLNKAIECIGGILFILSGLYMLNAYFAVMPGLAV